MASHVAKRRWFLRDFSRVYILLTFATIFGVVFSLGFDWSKIQGEPPGPILPPNYEAHYKGSIIFPTEQLEVCLVVALDNRTGDLKAKGYTSCDAIKIKAPERITPEKARLNAVGNAFRH